MGLRPRAGWEKNMEKKITRLEKLGIKDTVIGLRSASYALFYLIAYCIICIAKGYKDARLKDMMWILIVTVAVCIVQEILKVNFDEKDKLESREYIAMIVTAGVYGVASYFLDWTERDILMSGVFVLVSIVLSLWAYFEFKKYREVLAKKESFEKTGDADKKLTLGESFGLKDTVVGVRFATYFMFLLIGYCIYWAILGYANALLGDILGLAVITLVLCIAQEILKVNFDEKDKLGSLEYIAMAVTAVVYGVASYFFNWFEGDILMSGIFGLYGILLNLSAFLEMRKYRAVLAKKKELEK